MDVNSLYNTGNLTAELRAPVNNGENDEMIICSFSGEDDCSQHEHHITLQSKQLLSLGAICHDTRPSIDGSRGALAPSPEDAEADENLLYQWV